MAFTLLAQTAKGSASGNGVTTSPIDGTGAHLIVKVVASYAASGAPTQKDSSSNAWTGLTEKTVTGQVRAQIFYCANPVVSTAMTFESSGVASFPALWVGAFSASTGAGYEGHENGSTGTAATIQPGSVTPSVDNCLVVAGLALSGVVGTTINSTFVYAQSSGVDHFDNVGGQCFGVDAAHKIQASAGAENPTWTFSTTTLGTAAPIATFQSSTSGGGGGGSAIVPIIHSYRRRRR